jgi:coproporphyrinogen III oxidase-like Fe-S oxidoreductase
MPKTNKSISFLKNQKHNKMEQTLINLLKLNFDLDDFYSISIHPDYHPERILLQGHPSSENLLKYTKLGYTFIGDENKLIATKDRVRITFF